jgi:N-acetylmuramoyl-L-alanine amidase
LKDLELRLALIVGHSKKEGGAIGVAPLSMDEYHYNKEVAQLAYFEAKKLGIHAQVFLRDFTNRVHVCHAVNEFCAGTNACAIELHFDSFTDSKVRGTTTLYDMIPPESLTLARMIQDSVSKLFERTDKTNRGTKWLKFKDRGFYNMYGLDVPACLIEPGFGSNPYDAGLMRSLYREYARVIAETARDFLEGEKQK